MRCSRVVPAAMTAAARAGRRTSAGAALSILLMAATLRAEEPRLPDPPKAPPADRWGDPLPTGAIARLGTVRFRSHFTAQQIDLLLNDTFLLVRSRDLTLSLFDMPTGRKINVCTPRVAGIRSIAGARKGARIAAILTDGHLAIWDVPGLKRLLTYPLQEWKPTALCYSRDESQIVVGDSEGRLHFLDAATGRESSTLTLSCGGVRSLVGLISTGHVVALGDGGKIALCEPERAESAKELQGLPGATDVAAATQAPVFLSWEPHALQLRGIDGKVAVLDIPFKSGDLACAAISSDGKRVAAGLKDGSIVLFDDQGKRERAIAAHTGWTTGVRFTEDGRTLVTSGNELAARLWDPSSGAEIDPREGHRSGVSCLAVSPDGGRVASGGLDRTVRLWDGRSYAPLRVFDDLPEGAQAVAWSPKGDVLAVATGPFIDLLDTAGGVRQSRLEDGVGRIRSIAFTADGNFLAAGGSDARLRVWSVAEKKVVRVFTGHESGLRSVAVTSDGRFALSADGKGAPRLWSLGAGGEAPVISVGPAAIRAVAVSPDGKRFALGAADRKVRIWDAERGTVVASTAAFDVAVEGLAFSPDGKRIAACAERNWVRILDALSGKELTAFYWSGGAAEAVAWSPEGDRVFSAMWDGSILVWTVKP